MKSRGRRIRGAIGTGLTWGAAWCGGGFLLARVPGFYSDLPFALLFAPLGFAAGVLFSTLLVVVESRRGFARRSLLRFATCAAASGLLLSGVFVVAAALRRADSWREFLVFGPPLAVASAVCAAGSLALVKRAERRRPADDGGRSAETEIAEPQRRQ